MKIKYSGEYTSFEILQTTLKSVLIRVHGGTCDAHAFWLSKDALEKRTDR